MMKFTQRFYILSLLLYSCITGSLQAQFTVHKLFHVGYVYQNQSFGEIGGRLLFIKNDDVLYRLGASAMMGSTHSNFKVIPKLQGDILLNFEKEVDFYHAYYFLTSAEVTTKYIAPKIGVTFFGLLDFSGGYAFSLNPKSNGKEFKGLNLNFTLNIPIVAIQQNLDKQKN